MAGSISLAFDILAKDNASRTMSTIGDNAERTSKKVGGAFGGIGKTLAGAFAGFATVSVFKGFVADAEESRKVGRLTAQVIKTTGGAAQITADQVGNLANAISAKTGVDDEAIQSGANLLLTFTNVRNEVGKGNDVFNQATSLVTDMSVALGQDAKAGAIQLGKALNDPVKGVTALSKVGVSFTEQQKKQIATLVKSGDTLGAQKVILGELSKEFGGAAAAAATPSQKLGVAVGNLKESIGTALLPVVDRLATGLNNAIPKLQELWAELQTKLQPAFTSLGAFINDQVLPSLKALGGFYNDHKTLVQSVAVGVLAMVAAFKAYRTVVAVATAAQAALNLVMSLNPIGVVVLALVGLAAGLAFAYRKSETFRDIVSGAMHVVAVAVDFVHDHWKAFVTGFALLVGGPLLAAVVVIATHFGTFKSVALAAIQAVANVFLGMVGVLVHGAASAFGWVPGIGPKLRSASKQFDQFRDSVNASLNGIKDKQVNVDIVTRGTLPGGGLRGAMRDSDFAHRAMGGPVTAGRAYIVGEQRAEVFVPNQSGRIVAGAGGGQPVVINVNGALDPQAVARQIQSMLLKLQRETGTSLGFA